MNTINLSAIALILSCSAVVADEERADVPLVFANASGSDVVFSMVPARHDADNKITSGPFGIVRRLAKDGTLAEMYRTAGWYSSQVFVSTDGRYLVQMGPWNRGHRPDKTHLAVAFHKDGKLLKSYSTIELVKDAEKVKTSKSHYEWLASRVIMADYENRFTLRTIDGWTYEFDVTTGTIKSASKTDD